MMHKTLAMYRNGEKSKDTNLHFVRLEETIFALKKKGLKNQHRKE
jgi:hypothetical protein